MVTVETDSSLRAVRCVTVPVRRGAHPSPVGVRVFSGPR